MIYKRLILYLIFFSIVFSQGPWFSGNLRDIEEISLKLNLKGLGDDIWKKKIYSFIKLRLLEHNLQIVESFMPKLVVDIHVLDSRVEAVSSYLVIFSIYGYSITEPNYYQSMADTTITKLLMTSKVFSYEIMGQTSSKNLYKDIEKSINKNISIFLDQWYKDNPTKQF